MKSAMTLSNWAAFVWLWRHDPEAKWFWLCCYIKHAELQEDVAINYATFGRTK